MHPCFTILPSAEQSPALEHLTELSQQTTNYTESESDSNHNNNSSEDYFFLWQRIFEEENYDEFAAFELAEESCYLVYDSNLMQLFKWCRNCGSAVESDLIERRVVRSTLLIKNKCLQGHELPWESVSFTKYGCLCRKCGFINNVSGFTTVHTVYKNIEMKKRNGSSKTK